MGGAAASLIASGPLDFLSGFLPLAFEDPDFAARQQLAFTYLMAVISRHVVHVSLALWYFQICPCHRATLHSLHLYRLGQGLLIRVTCTLFVANPHLNKCPLAEARPREIGS